MYHFLKTFLIYSYLLLCFFKKRIFQILTGDLILFLQGSGDLFGDDISKTRSVRRSNGDVRALMYCDILYLTRKDFKDVFQNYPDFPSHFSSHIGLAFDLGAKSVSYLFMFLNFKGSFCLEWCHRYVSVSSSTMLRSAP